jgi:23S rRNA (cytidine1920-2'-O)/16S rRNA (cytidine1409-2'-O)-methyltransferase
VALVRRRLDAELVRRGLVGSREEARQAIAAGSVLLRGGPATKPSSMVGEHEPLEVHRAVRRFVSRGGDKLDAALDRFSIDVAGHAALDAGASTGGFTDVLLRRGADRVIAVDVGYGQLDWSLRSDPRVTVLDRTNVRSLRADRLAYRPRIVVADLSFISLALVIPALVGVSDDVAEHIYLVKPQFEAGRQGIGKGGVVRDPGVWASALASVTAAARRAGLVPRGVMSSPLRGPAGNVEFLLWSSLGSSAPDIDLDRAIADAIGEAPAARGST